MIRPVQTEVLLAVIGSPVRHSLSPAMMNAALSALKLPAVYLAFEVEELQEALDAFSKLGFHGLSVTLPHKEAAARLAWRIDDTAAAIGAVNTLRRCEDRWEGCNTDWLGAMMALKQAGPIEDKHAVVIGAGGAARAVVYGLMREGARVSIANRTPERARTLAQAFGCEWIALDELGKDRFDIAVQCTSAGMSEGDPLDMASGSFFHPGMVAMDVIYCPVWTPFLHSAKKAGCKVVSGLDMLLHQGSAQLEWWLGRRVPVTTMRDALKINAAKCA